MSPINSLSNNYLQGILSTAFQGTGLSPNPAGTSVGGIGSPSDNSRLSPFAQLMSTLQQLQQSDPAKYQQVTQQIAANLQAAAQTAQANGNSTAATQLTQLSKDFTTASTSGQLPSVQDLAQAVGGRHHHHHHSAATDSDANSTTGSSSTSASSSSSSQALSQLLSAFQANATQNAALDPMSIIQNTLSSAGISIG